MAPPRARDQIERVLALVRRALVYWKRAALVFIVGAAIAVPYVMTRPRAYRSETVILYQETIRSGDMPGGEGGGEGARRVGARLREVLLSRANLEPIITDMHLYEDRIVHGELIGAVEEFRKNITFRAKEGDAFEISFTADTPQLTQEVTRRLGETMLKDSTVRRTEQAKTVKEFLNEEAARNDADLKVKEAALASFVTLHPEFAPRLRPPGSGGDVGNGRPGGGFRGTSTDPLLNILEARQARIEKQLKSAKADPNAPAPKPAATFVPPADGPELVAARKDYQEKSSLYTEKHPDVIAARNRLRAAEQAQAATNAAAEQAWRDKNDVAPAPVGTAPIDEAALRKELSDVQLQMAQRRAQLAKAAVPAPSGTAATPAPTTTVAPTVELELEFNRLSRDVNDARDRQQKLDDRLFRASLTASSAADERNIQVAILDPAYLPIRPVSKPRSMLLGGLLAVVLLLSLATAFGSAMLEDKVYDRIDVERLDILPVLAVIPPAPRDQMRRLPRPQSNPDLR
jgi:uncharacterized protein involved in exopolysaccharide biosynthesis